MSPPSAPKVLLKARPTEAQIVDRLREPVPDGLELYLDAQDIQGEGWQPRLVSLIRGHRPEGFDLVVEGPLRSLDGGFFDVTKPSAANREVIDRLVSLGQAIGAKAAVIHAMAARLSASAFDLAARHAALEDALPLCHHYVTSCLAAGLVPTIENVPPVARMREGSFMFSLIGTSPSDMLALLDVVPDLRVTVDVSHAQLYVNAYRATRHEVQSALRPMVEFLQAQPGVASVDDFIRSVSHALYEAHISNARSLLGEGLPYDQGELDLDAIIRHLARHTAYLVTETIEPDPDDARFMREAQRRISQVILRHGEDVNHDK